MEAADPCGPWKLTHEQWSCNQSRPITNVQKSPETSTVGGKYPGVWHSPGGKKASRMGRESFPPTLTNPCPKQEHQHFQRAHFLILPHMFFRLQSPKRSAPHDFTVFPILTRSQIHPIRYWLASTINFLSALFPFCSCPPKSQPLTNPIHVLQLPTQAVERQLEKFYNNMGLFLLKMAFHRKLGS